MNYRKLASVGTLTLALSPAAPASPIGPDDFRISQMGADLSDEYGAGNPDVAYNAFTDEFLVVWEGTDNTPPLVQFESEIFAARIDAATGRVLTDTPIRVSFMGPNGNINFAAYEPAVAWNPVARQYVVVWQGDDSTGSLVQGEMEIYAQRLTALGELFGDVERVSFMGEDGDDLAGALDPDIVFASGTEEYFVVWYGDDIDGVNFVDQDFEVFGQRLSSATLSRLGPNLRLSDMGEEDANPSFNAADARVTYNPDGERFLVVWEGDDDAGDTVNGEQEIYGQLVDATTGLETGENDFRISELGPVGATDYDSTNPAAVYNPVRKEYLVVWNGSNDEDGSVRNDIEIYGQRLNALGEWVDPLQQRISSMGIDGSTAWWGLAPDVAYSPDTGGYLVVWQGEDNTGDLANNEWEIYAQFLRFDLTTNSPRSRLTTMGGDGQTVFDAFVPSVARDTERDRFLTVFPGNDLRPDLAEREREIFGQFVGDDPVFLNGFE